MGAKWMSEEAIPEQEMNLIEKKVWVQKGSSFDDVAYDSNYIGGLIIKSRVGYWRVTLEDAEVFKQTVKRVG